MVQHHDDRVSAERAHVLDHMPARWPTLLRVLATSVRRAPEGLESLPHSVWQLDQVRVDRARVERYAQLCGLPIDPERIPLIFPQLMGFPLLLRYFGSPDCPWPAMGIVHLGNEIDSLAPIAVGDALRLTLSTGALIRHPKGQAFTVLLRAERGGQAVWSVRQTLLRLGVRTPSGPDWDESAIVGGPAQAQAVQSPFERAGEFDAPRGIGRRYAPVSGDFNPIHLSTLAARLLGFQQTIAHGLWSLARALAVLGEGPRGWPPDAPVRLSTVFGSPVRLPSRVVVWRAGAADGAQAFELRDARGERIHLRTRLTPDLPREPVSPTALPDTGPTGRKGVTG